MKHRVFTISLFIVYITTMTAIMIWQGIGIAPDRYVFILFLGTLLIKKTRQFILDWLPFIFLLLSYDFLRGLAGKPIFPVHYQELIQADQAIFGFLPTQALQTMFFQPSTLSWYDFLFTILYFLHFALPLAFAFLLWMLNRTHFREFITGILMLSYAAWVTFVIFPAAPPWLASQEGYSPKVYKILDSSLTSFPEKLKLPTIYHTFNPNPIAAVPSLHAAYPLLVFLFSLHFFKKKAIFFLPYVLTVWLSIVYLGEHYVVDVVAGAIYAVVFYALSHHIIHKINWDQALNKFLKNLPAEKLGAGRPRTMQSGINIKPI